MASPPPMSTPVQNLPPTPASQQMIEDPAIRDVLKEMESEVAAASAANRAPNMPHAQQMPHHAHMPHHAPMPNFPMMMGPPQGGFQTEIAKRALFAAIVAAILFHPMLADLISSRIPFLSTSELYMMAARVLLLAVVFYILMWKLDL